MVTLFADDYASLESTLSTRQSIHAYTRYAPVDVTLAVPGTAENLLAVDAKLPTVNLVTNPSMETGDPPTGFVAVGSTIAQSAAQFRSGANSLSIDPDNAAANEGAYWILPRVGGGGAANNQIYIVASVYLRRATGTGANSQIAIADSSGNVLATGNSVGLSETWTRSVVKYPIPIGTSDAFRVYVTTAAQHNITFFADDMQVELRQDGNDTDYADGAQGLWNEWVGAAHASMSIRKRGLRIIKGFSLRATLDTYLAFDHTADSVTGLFLPAGSTMSSSWPLDFKSNISMINVNSGEAPRVHGVVWGYQGA